MRKMLFFLFIVGLTIYSWNADVSVTLTVTNRQDEALTAEPVTSGVPFAIGVLTNLNRVRLLDGSTEIPAQFRVLARWPDNSIRWLRVDFQLDLPPSGTVPLTLQTGSAPAAVTGITVDNQASSLTVNTGVAIFTFNKNEFMLGGNYFHVKSGGTTYRAKPTVSQWSVEEPGPMKTIIRSEGNFYSGSTRLGSSLIGYRARLVFSRGKDLVRLYLTFRNNSALPWDWGLSPAPETITLSYSQMGIFLLPAGGSYVFGPGVEKTWELDVPAGGNPVYRDTRYDSSGNLLDGYTAPRPLALATPSYYTSTGAWGVMALPLTGFSTDRQADFDLYEKLQRSKVILADVESPAGLEGETIWGHLYQDAGSWNDYGDLRWGGGCGPLSGNHYDWPYGMFLHFFRTGRLAFLDAGLVLARHEIDLDLYHTGADGAAFNYWKNWESRPSHETPDNCFGGGRPSHTWFQGYALYWLLTGDPRGKDAVDELSEGLRQYVYESFNNEGYIDTNEIRIQGWLVDSLINLWRIDPNKTFSTTNYGTKTIPQVIKDILKSVFDLEAAAGKNGYVYAESPPQANLSQPLMNCYFIEPAIKAYLEVFKGRDAAYAANLLGLIRRMTTWLISITYGGTSDGTGRYLPRQIPYMVDRNLTQQTDGQVPYILMAANAAGFCFTETGVNSYRDYMQKAFRDYIRYLGVAPGDYYIDDPSQRTPTSFNSNVYPDTEPKIHGWSNRYGQYYLAAEQAGQAAGITVTSPNGGESWQSGTAHPITWTGTGTAISTVKIELSLNNGLSWSTVIASTANDGSYSWTVPSSPSAQCLIRITGTANTAVTDRSDGTFTIYTASGTPVISLSRTALYFGARAGQAGLFSQQVFIANSGSGTLAWNASSTRDWLKLTPQSGTGSTTIDISVDAAQLAAGEYTGTVTVTAGGAANSPQVIQVTLKVYAGTNGPFGSFDTPTDNSVVSGSVAITGWALDDIGVDSVKIYREEGGALIYIGDAVFIEGARPDIEGTYPGIPSNYKAGWGYMMLTNFLPNQGNGTFVLHAVAADRESHSVDLGTKTITCDNVHAVKPFGTIDIPAQGGTASGSSYTVSGWVLTPQPADIPSDGSTIRVYVDGVYKGTLTYNIYRPDVAGLFPGLANSNGAAGYFKLDTTAYENGIHSIYWLAADSAGNSEGIGSRFFIIQNPGL